MRFRYRAYMGGPDPLAEPDPPPEEAVAAARELLVLVTSALETGSATSPKEPEAGSATGPEGSASDSEALGASHATGSGVLAEEDRRRRAPRGRRWRAGGRATRTALPAPARRRHRAA